MAAAAYIDIVYYPKNELEIVSYERRINCCSYTQNRYWFVSPYLFYTLNKLPAPGCPFHFIDTNVGERNRKEDQKEKR